MHQKSATTTPFACTKRVQHDELRHARLGVQHQSLQPCTTRVQHNLHPRGCNTGQPLQDNKTRHAHSCKTDENIYRNLTAPSPQPITNSEPTDRVRGNEVRRA